MADDIADKTLLAQLEKLREKYDYMGQDMSSYLDGLLYSDYLTYWDYIHLETLLSLQNPRTRFPDEKVFIIYHQITELYFKLVLHEIEQIAFRADLDASFFIDRMDRIIRYFRNLEQSFDIMVKGLDKEEFRKFRMALLPASGFQSAQYRLIEIGSTDVINIVAQEEREALRNAALREQVQNLYWRRGATDLKTGNKTLTLKQFEERYMEQFHSAAEKYRDRNLRQIFLRFSEAPERDALVSRLREYDLCVNVYWPLVHIRSAAVYLKNDPEVLKATGGTNWTKYLPPRFQKRIFFPELWSSEEVGEWGKAAIERQLRRADAD